MKNNHNSPPDMEMPREVEMYVGGVKYVPEHLSLSADELKQIEELLLILKGDIEWFPNSPTLKEINKQLALLQDRRGV